MAEVPFESATNKLISEEDLRSIRWALAKSSFWPIKIDRIIVDDTDLVFVELTSEASDYCQITVERSWDGWRVFRQAISHK